METAAGVFGENLIAIVLSGTGTDGTEGARTVSQAGGTVIIQDPATAEFGEMPRSLAPSTVDIVSSLEDIGPVLKNLISGIAMPEENSEEQGLDLERFLEELHRNRGVDFRSYMTSMKRLNQRLRSAYSQVDGAGHPDRDDERYADRDHPESVPIRAEPIPAFSGNEEPRSVMKLTSSWPTPFVKIWIRTAARVTSATSHAAEQGSLERKLLEAGGARRAGDRHARGPLERHRRGVRGRRGQS